MRLKSLIFFCVLSFINLAAGVDYMGLKPSKLSEFTVYSKGDHVKITWKTKSRKDIIDCTIERSRDGKNFEVLKKIGDDGVNPTSMEFFEVDNEPLPGWSYYRIGQGFSNGDYAFSEIAPIFYGMDRLRKGAVIVAKNPNDPGTTKVNLAKFNQEKVLMVARDTQGVEYYIHEMLFVKGNKLSVKATTTVPKGFYTITASSIDELLGLELIAE